MKKEKRKILKIRPFNMANFSGGSGYLVFSIFYQVIAIFPAMLIIWLASLIKLPKLDEDGKIDYNRALKRYNIVSIPLCAIIAVFGVIMAFVGNYGTFFEYGIEVLFVGLMPAISLFFIVRFCHLMITEHDKKVWFMIVLSVILMIADLFIIYLFCIGLLDPILSEIADKYGY